MPLIPLFPLELVLFPGTLLPLHIFEPRYKELIGECLAGEKLFGIVRSKDKGIAQQGTTAKVVEVVKRYEDGRMDIVTEGLQRFEIVNVDEARAFLRGEVSYFDDDDGPDAEAELRGKLLDLHAQMVKLSGEEIELPDAAHPQLSFQVCAALPLDLDFKQGLLGLRSERERIIKIIQYYEVLLPRLRLTIKARAKAGGNGHVS